MDKNLEPVFLIDEFKSLIWAKRYRELGDCELYLPASSEALEVLRQGYYIARSDDEMVCRINYVQLTTDTENGNYITVKGIDTKAFLDQRIVWGTGTCRGNLEAFILKMVDKSVGAGAQAWRRMLKQDGTQLIACADPQGFDTVWTEQVSYQNVGEKVREYCEKNGWGYRFTREGGKLIFGLYAGTDRTDEVIFSDEYENISTTAYTEDDTNLGNVALVAGEGEGSKRAKEVSGEGRSTERYEIYVDAKDISRSITFEALKGSYPTGTAVSGHGVWYWRVSNLDVQIVDAAHLASLEANYSGEVVTVDGITYYRVYLAAVAVLPSGTPADNDNVELTDLVYQTYLLNRGYEKLAAYGAITAFEGQIDTNSTFRYKEDFDLGDLVTVASSYGVTAAVRITEVVEVEDDNGYRCEPSFEYIEG